MYTDAKLVKRVASLGAGPIGGGWTAHFLARGYDVTAYLHDKSETSSFMSILMAFQEVRIHRPKPYLKLLKVV